MANELKNKLQKLDEKLSYQCYRSVPKTKKWKSALKALELSCHGIGWLTITLILIYSNPEHQPYAYLLGGLLIDIVVVALVKAAARRRRPVYTTQTDQLFMVLSDKHSFPSGHCSRAIFVALFVHLFFKNLILTSLFTVWAASVAVSRVLLGRHFIFDVLSGCCLGYLEYLLQFGLLHNLINPLFFSLVVSVLSVNTNDMDMDSFGLD